MEWSGVEWSDGLERGVAAWGCKLVAWAHGLAAWMQRYAHEASAACMRACEACCCSSRSLSASHQRLSRATRLRRAAMRQCSCCISCRHSSQQPST